MIVVQLYFDVHDGGYSLFLVSEQGRAEADPQVGYVHHVLLGVGGHLFKVPQQQFKHPFVRFGQSVHQTLDFGHPGLVGFQLCKIKPIHNLAWGCLVHMNSF